ncbi:MAG: MFS transporter [Azospirillaceae bacterium]
MSINRTSGSIIAFYFLLYASFGFLAPYVALFLERRGWSGTDIGIALFALTGAGFLGQFVFGFLADRTGRKRAIIAGLALGSGILCATWLTATGAALFAAIVALGLFHRPLVPLMDSATFDHLGGEGRERYSFFRVGGSVGFLAASVIASVLVIPQFGLPGAFAAFAIAMIVAAPLTRAFGRPGSVSRPGQSFTLTWISDRRIVATALMMFLLEFASTGIQGYLGIYIDRYFDLPDNAIPIAWSIGLVAELALFFAAPFLLTRLSVRTVLLIGGGSAVLRYAILATGLATTSPTIFFASQLLHGVYYSIFFAAALGYLDSSSPAHLRASVLATAHAFSTLAGLLLGYLVNGWLLDSLGLRALFGISAGVAAVGVMILFTGLMPRIGTTLDRLGGDDALHDGDRTVPEFGSAS